MLMLSLGFVTRYGGTDATLGLAFTKTGVLYPFFAALLGWLGVALTGSDTSSNVLFGSLQKITAQQLGFNPVLIATANSTGGVMGKMIDAQSIVVATASTGQVGQEGRILRFVFWHSVALVDPHGHDRDAAGLRAPVDGAGAALSPGAAQKLKPVPILTRVPESNPCATSKLSVHQRGDHEQPDPAPRCQSTSLRLVP